MLLIWCLLIQVTTVLAINHPPDVINVTPRRATLVKPNLKTRTPPARPPPPGNVVIVVAVISSAVHFQRRLAIRSTWGSIGHRNDVRLAFVVAMPTESGARRWVLREARLHGDLWMGDFYDTFGNLTLKSVMVLERVQLDYPAARIVVKVDDDCFLNPYALFAFARGMTSSERDGMYLYGRLFQSNPVIREPDNKYYVSVDQYEGDTFPLFAGGPAYVMTRSAVAALRLEATLSVDLRKPFPMEDVFITGICADKARVVRVHREQMEYDRPYEVGMDLTDHIVIHGLKPEDLFACWTTLHDNVDSRMGKAWGLK